jgi:hypothetical protein
MKISLALALALTLVSVRIAHSEEGEAARRIDTASQKVMQHWVGDWTGGVAGAADAVVPHMSSVPDHAKVQWTLDNFFLKGMNLDKNNKAVGVWLMRHNAKTDQYQVWFFNSKGDVSQWNGSWDDEKQTMTWKTRGDESGITGSGHTSFANNRQQWEMDVIKDGKTERSSGSLTRK